MLGLIGFRFAPRLLDVFQSIGDDPRFTKRSAVHRDTLPEGTVILDTAAEFRTG